MSGQYTDEKAAALTHGTGGAEANEDPLQEDEPNLSGLVLDERYRLLRRLGMGGMGVVYEGEHIKLGTRVAVKVLRREFALRQGTHRRRFLREARSAATVHDPNVVQILDFGETENDIVYFVMEYIVGRDLSEIVSEVGRIPWPRARGIALQVASGLHAAHHHRIVHRDVKASNCIVYDDARRNQKDLLKVVDFGIAKVDQDDGNATQSLTATDELFGTVAYMAPELVDGRPASVGSDMYAMGVMMFYMLTGALPFNGPTALKVLTLHMTAEPPRPRSIEPRIPEEVETIILRCLAKTPEDRFADMCALARAIDAVPEQAVAPGLPPPTLKSSAPTEAPPERPPSPDEPPSNTAGPLGVAVAPTQQLPHIVHTGSLDVSRTLQIPFDSPGAAQAAMLTGRESDGVTLAPSSPVPPAGALGPTLPSSPGAVPGVPAKQLHTVSAAFPVTPGPHRATLILLGLLILIAGTGVGILLTDGRDDAASAESENPGSHPEGEPQSTIVSASESGTRAASAEDTGDALEQPSIPAPEALVIDPGTTGVKDAGESSSAEDSAEDPIAPRNESNDLTPQPSKRKVSKPKGDRTVIAGLKRKLQAKCKTGNPSTVTIGGAIHTSGTVMGVTVTPASHPKKDCIKTVVSQARFSARSKMASLEPIRLVL